MREGTLSNTWSIVVCEAIRHGWKDLPRMMNSQEATAGIKQREPYARGPWIPVIHRAMAS